MAKHKNRICRKSLLYSSIVAIVLFAFVNVFVYTVPIHASSYSLSEESDSTSVGGEDITGGDNLDEDDDLAESIALTENPSFGSINAYTSQGTKAQTLRSRTVYIVNGKKQIKK